MWILDFLVRLPEPVAYLLLVAIGIGVGQALIWAVDRAIPRWRRERVNELLGMLLAVVAVVYAVPLGLVAVEAWGDFTEARSAVTQEATQIARLADAARSLPEPMPGQVTAALKAYAQTVIEHEWRQMTAQGYPRAAEPELERIRLLLQAAGELPSADVERVKTDLQQLATLRLARILSIGEGLIPPVWSLVLVGGFVTMLLCALFAPAEMGLHRLICGLVATSIMTVVLLIVATDRPFHRVTRVGPEAIERVLEGALSEPSPSATTP